MPTPPLYLLDFRHNERSACCLVACVSIDIFNAQKALENINGNQRTPPIGFLTLIIIQSVLIISRITVSLRPVQTRHECALGRCFLDCFHHKDKIDYCRQI